VCQRLDGAGHKRLALYVTRRYGTWNWRLNGIDADHRETGMDLTPEVKRLIPGQQPEGLLAFRLETYLQC
jgi:hypothetical protein